MALGADILEAIAKQSRRPLSQVIEAFTRFIPRIDAARPAAKVVAPAPAPRPVAPVPRPAAPAPRAAAPEPAAPAPRAVAPEPQVPVVRRAAEPAPVGPVRVSEPVVPSVQAEAPGQLRLPFTERGEGGRFLSPYGRGTVDPDVVRASLTADVAPPVRIPDPWAGDLGRQLDLPLTYRRPPVEIETTFMPRGAASSIEAMSSPLRGVGELDAGTLRSLQDLSQRASRQYGIPSDEIFRRITAPGGTDYLNELAGRNALQNITGRIASSINEEALNKVLAGLSTGAGITGLGLLGYEIGRPKTPFSQEQIDASIAALQQMKEEKEERLKAAPEAPVLPQPEAPLARVLGGDSATEPLVAPRRQLVPLGAGPGETPVAAVPVAQKPLGAPTLEPGGDLAAYYKARSEYAQQPAIRQELVEFVTQGLEGQQARDLATWAKQNPHLAYEMKRRAMADPDQSLQTNQNTTSSALSTELGTDNSNNAQGSADAVSSSAMNPSAGSYDMMAATRPLEKPVLLGAQQVRNYAEGSLETGETFADKLLRMAARRQQIA